MTRNKFVLLLLLAVNAMFAQDLSKLTPEQIEMYKKYKASTSQNSQVSTDQNVIDVERKVNDDENQNQNTTGTTNKPATDQISQNNSTFSKKQPSTKNPKDSEQNENNGGAFFGSYLFTNNNITFEPKLNIATPVNYVLGTYDELNIDITGYYEANYKLKVSPEGQIRIPNVGMIKVGGITIERATSLIRSQVARVYMGVNGGETKVNVSLGSIRSIRISVVGEAVRPGTYTLPSLATAFNALYACGGPNEIGSMRNIKVIRGGRVVANMDAYHYLVDGSMTDNILLHDQDVIKIEPYKVRAVLNGAVKHPAIFQLRENETLQNLIQYAGGFSDNANKGKITVIRLTDKGKTVIDVQGKDIAGFIIKPGDICNITKTYAKFDNRVDITGAVYRPGVYALSAGMTIKELIAKADGIKEDAYLNMAYINRKKENKIPEILGFNLGNVLTGKEPDIFLQKDDSIVIHSLFEFREGEKVSIFGAVKAPGSFPLIQNITLKDLIAKAKGFSEMAASDSIELVRPVKDPLLLREGITKSIVLKFSMDKDLNFKGNSQDILLENGDQVIVREISGYEGIRMVKIEGEVYHPGSYNVLNKSERISNLVKRSGGITQFAYTKGAFLIRTDNPDKTLQKLNQFISDNIQNSIESNTNSMLSTDMLKNSGQNSLKNIEAMDSIQRKLSGGDVVNEIFNNQSVVSVNLSDIIAHPGGASDLKLEENDVLYVPRIKETVRVMGEILFPTTISFTNGMSVRDYINSSGGFNINANKSKVFVIYANGSAQSTRKFLWFKIYPKIEAGSKIVIPRKPVEIKSKITVAETVGILSSIASTAAIVYSILK